MTASSPSAMPPRGRTIEVLVPVTINALDQSGAGVGVIVGWQGATPASGSQCPVGLTQPYSGHNFPAVAWDSGTPGNTTLGLYANTTTKCETPLPGATSTPQLAIGSTYWFKIDVQQDSATTSKVKFKVWANVDGTTSGEPSAWTVTDDTDQVSQGSIVLAAYEADASFGNVKATPLASLFP